MKHDRLTQFSPAVQQAIRRCRENLSDECDIDDGRAYLPYDADRHLVRLVESVLQSEYPDHGALLDAIRAEAKEKPHSMAWCKCRDAVTTEAMALADSIRAGGGQC